MAEGLSVTEVGKGFRSMQGMRRFGARTQQSGGGATAA